MARHLDLDGDEQADLAGHGGENRAMLVYQLDSYRFWQQMFGDGPYAMGWFGENLTVEGLPDHEVCVGDRFRIGEALVEVTQPRVTCYRLGMRTGRPEMASLFVKHGRPGFYVRVLEEGTIGADDRIELVGEAREPMTVTSIDKLLYLEDHPAGDLRRALSIDALSEGWKGSFRQLLEAQKNGPMTGNLGLSPPVGKEPWQGFRPLVVLSNKAEAQSVRSIQFGLPDGCAPLPPFQPGQHIVLKIATAERDPLVRSYSLSGDPADSTYRISIKREPGGTGSAFLQDYLQAGTAIDVSAPRGGFTLNQKSTAPVVLLSAGIGVTPVLSMLHMLAKTQRRVYWIHGARDGSHLSFRDEVHSLLAALPSSKQLVVFSHPSEKDILEVDYDLPGRLDMGALARLDLPQDAEYYLCGPAQFLEYFREGLDTTGVGQDCIHIESFGGVTSQHSPAAARTSSGEAVFKIAFTRSNRVLEWAETNGSLLELAEAEQVPVLWSCRVGVCHRCENSLLSGNVAYEPQPLDPPSAGRVLLCCAYPTSDLVVDL